MLRREALVVVLVGGDDDLGAGLVEVVPERCGVAPTPLDPGREHRIVPVREHALRGIRGQLGTQPGLLGRARTTTADGRALGVERNDVPPADVETVVTHSETPGGGTKVSEVPSCVPRRVTVRPTGSDVVAVAGARMRDREVAPPAWAVRLLVGAVAATAVLRIAEGQNRGGHQAREQIRGRLLVAVGGCAVSAVELRGGWIAGDVARSREDTVDRDAGRHDQARRQPA